MAGPLPSDSFSVPPVPPPVIVAACDGYRLVRRERVDWVLEKLGTDATDQPTWGTVFNSFQCRHFGIPEDTREAITALVGILMKTEV